LHYGVGKQNGGIYDDGSAVIDGKPLRFTETAWLRVRHLTPYNLIINSQSSVYIQLSQIEYLKDT